MNKNYYVRRTFEEKEYQKGSFENLDNAKKCCDKNPGYNIYDWNGEEVYSGPKATVSTIIRSAVSWAKSTAADNTHGYDNRKGHRGGNPDYACSSFVNESYRQAGVNLPESESVYTSKMRSIYIKAGFKDVTKQVNFKTKKGFKTGDVLLTPGKHVELYVGSSKLAGARGTANSGKAENGKKGDQTGGEIAVGAYYNFPWKYCLRYVGSDEEKKDTKPKVTYMVQTGSYTYKGNALKHIDKLKVAGFDAILKQSNKIYIVQAGLFANRSNAESLVRKLRNKKFDAVIKEIS